MIIPAPYFRRFADNPRVKAFVDGVTAAATGAIAGAAFVLGRRALTDVGAVLIALTTWFLFSRFKKLPGASGHRGGRSGGPRGSSALTAVGDVHRAVPPY